MKLVVILVVLGLSICVEGQFFTAGSPLAALLNAPKRTSAQVYAGQQLGRPIVQQVQRSALAPVAVPSVYSVGTALGPAYGFYNRLAAVPYQYSTTHVHYKPVESHGYSLNI